MKNSEVLSVGVAESSAIIRSGLAYVLKRLPNLRITTVELASTDALYDCLRTQPPHVLFVNPNFGDYFDVTRFKNEPLSKGIHVIALVCSLVDSTALSKYDGSISIFDDLDTIASRINSLQHIQPEPLEEGSESLSIREKEIVTCVVKGMTNKEIAEKLFLSIHTVITHRRNISRKLQIHSVSGLTIYAIVNKLVELSDVKGL